MGLSLKTLDREFGKSHIFRWPVILFLGFAGCGTTVIVNSQLPERLRDLKSVSVAPPKVQIYDDHPGSGGSGRVFSSPESSAAEMNFAAAVKQQLDASGQFTVKNLDLNRDPQATREFTFLTFWEPRDLYFIGRSAPPCVPFLNPGSQQRRPLLALRQAAEADALLLTYGLSVDKTEEKQRSVSRALGFAYLFPPTAMIMVPLTLLSPGSVLQSVFGSGKSALQICMIDTKTGEELWSYFAEINGRDRLRDPANLKAIVAEAFESFPVTVGELKEN